jgi:hydrogenase/urease accessory protein HupE
MPRRPALASLLAAGLAALLVAAPGAAHPGHHAREGLEVALPHPLHHLEPFLGVLAVAVIAAGVAFGIARRRRSVS